MKARILTIVVTYNGMKWVDRCLGSLVYSKTPADVFVVDNGSSDGTVEHIRECFPDVLLHCTGDNLGFGKANNIGLRYALKHGYDYVYLLNQDAWVFPETLGILVDAMKSDRSLGILSPMQMTATCGRPDPRFERKCPQKALRDLSRGRHSGKVYETAFVMAAHWMISRECVRHVGGFSPAFPHYGEDDNYIHRAKSKGYRIGVHSGALAVHDRENRPMTKEASMKLKCVASVVKVSNPLDSLWLRMIFQPIELLAISIRYRSGYVFRYIFTLVKSYRRLVALRRESEADMAFLEPFE